MTDRTEILDGAIQAATEQIVKTMGDTDGMLPLDNIGRQFARVLIAYIANHMSRHITSPMVWMGYSIALDDLREIAGIEPEKVYEHNDGN